jgi:hypothetical protein
MLGRDVARYMNAADRLDLGHPNAAFRYDKRPVAARNKTRRNLGTGLFGAAATKGRDDLKNG